ncbi:hypothetical protein H4582DRAFT_2059433 [Lactarius indigo]|nr:hypothetical protein H4582DRAFT_2059433 [Lactarius indigo]
MTDRRFVGRATVYIGGLGGVPLAIKDARSYQGSYRHGLEPDVFPEATRIAVALATAFVVPPHSSDDTLQDTFQVPPASSTTGSNREWNLPPNSNSTHHLIFNSVGSLLQLWPNILRRNGHSLIPTTIPKGTILYHGRTDDRIPNEPDWLAFDFEHAYLFGFRSCYMISLQAKRDLRLVYFDGSSAAKMKDGPMDFSGCPLVGTAPTRQSSPSSAPYPGISRPYLGVSQAFRFRSPSHLHLSLHPAGVAHCRMDTASSREAYLAGSWHNLTPGETRVRPDYSGLVTFYDPSLSSLVESRHGKDRLHLRLDGISALDSERVRAELQTVLMREPPGGGSGTDWGSIARVVKERYAGRLEYLRFLLSPNTSTADALERAAIAREQLFVMLAPYITITDVPKRLPPSANLSWAAPVAHRCAMTQTSHISLGILTPQESGTRSVKYVDSWFFRGSSSSTVEAADKAGATEALKLAHGYISGLMAWLDWPEWVRCEPGCGLGVRVKNMVTVYWGWFSPKEK